MAKFTSCNFQDITKTIKQHVNGMGRNSVHKEAKKQLNKERNKKDDRKEEAINKMVELNPYASGIIINI